MKRMTQWAIGLSTISGCLLLAGLPAGAHAQTPLFEVVRASDGFRLLVVNDNGHTGIGLTSPQKALDIATRGGIRLSRTEGSSPDNEIFFQDNGQIRSRDNNHRIIFDRPNDVMELREFGRIILSAGATSGQRTTTVEVTRDLTTVNGSLSAGQGNLIRAANSMALGSGHRIEASFATALGANNLVTGLLGTAIGQHTTASGNNSTAIGTRASTNSHAGSFVYGDASTTQTVHASRANQFVVRAQHFWLGEGSTVTSPANHFMTTTTGAFLSRGGVWTNLSDANRKENFRAEDGEAVLAKIARLPVPSWNYTHEDATVRHLGPTAQDFHAAFGLGIDETSIGTVDIAGVNLLAVQALERRTAELRVAHGELIRKAERIEALEQRIDDLESRNLELDRRLTLLEDRLGSVR